VTRRRAAQALVFAVLTCALFLVLHAGVAELQDRPAVADGGRIVDLPGGDLHVREDGPRDAPPIVLLHGLAASTRWWDGVVGHLSGRHRVVRIDLLGHGGSEKPRDGYAMDEQADRLAALLERLHVPPATVVGHSLGGVVAAALAVRHPGRVERLVTIGTPAEWPAVERLSHRIVRWPLLGPAVRGLTPQPLIAREYPTAGLAEDFRRMTWRAFDRSADAMERHLEAAPLDRRLAGGEVPLLALFGSRERAAREGQPERLAALRRARVRVLAGQGHSPFVDRPGPVADIVARFAQEGR
jgi:pimeloyl-ACP methyl ester carboxylesterase